MTVSQEIEFVGVFTKEVDGYMSEWATDKAKELMRCARTLHHRYTVACNHPMEAHYERETTKLENRVVELLQPHKIGVVFQDDPRGAPVKLKLPSGKANDFGGEGYYCVPWMK